MAAPETDVPVRFGPNNTPVPIEELSKDVSIKHSRCLTCVGAMSAFWGMWVMLFTRKRNIYVVHGVERFRAISDVI